MTDIEPGGDAEAPSDKVELMEPKKITRFKVNRVDLSLSNPEELNKLVDNAEDLTSNYAKSFRHFTREALPRLDNYRNIMSIQAVYRPTLDDLHEDNASPPPVKVSLNGRIYKFMNKCIYIFSLFRFHRGSFS